MSRGPLQGQRVVITRARHQAESWLAAFEGAGAAVECLPLIEIVAPEDLRPLRRAASQLAQFDWLVLTSTNAVDAFFAEVTLPIPPTVRLAVVGPKTAGAARKVGMEPSLIASRSDAEGLVDELNPLLSGNAKVLLPRADDGRRSLVEGLNAVTANLVTVDAYSKRLPTGAAEQARQLFTSTSIGWVTFSSPRIVQHFVGLFGTSWSRRGQEVRALSIGPVTTRELESQGITWIAEAARPSPEEMVSAATWLATTFPRPD